MRMASLACIAAIAAALTLSGCIVEIEQVQREQPQEMAALDDQPTVVEQGDTYAGQVVAAPVDVETQCDWVFVENVGWSYWHPGLHVWVLDHARAFDWRPAEGHYHLLHSWAERPRDHLEADGRFFHEIPGRAAPGRAGGPLVRPTVARGPVPSQPQRIVPTARGPQTAPGRGQPPLPTVQPANANGTAANAQKKKKKGNEDDNGK